MTPEGEHAKPWWLLPPGRLSATWWLAILGPLLAIDYLAGVYSRFPLVYAIPVSLAAYYSGRWPALTLAFAIPIAQYIFEMLAGPPVDLLTLVGAAILRNGFVVVMALWFARLSEHERALRDEVQTLRGLLHICAFCKNIRNDAGEWERLEGFISRRSQTEFSHAICPSCRKLNYPPAP